jgi:hypothetical protein
MGNQFGLDSGVVVNDHRNAEEGRARQQQQQQYREQQQREQQDALEGNSLVFLLSDSL